MRLLHTSDWHLGRAFHGHSLIEHQRQFLGWLVEVARAEQVDAVVVAGDVYDRALPSVEAVELFEHALIALTGVCPVVLTSGNHDSAIRLGFGGALLERADVHLRTAVADLDRPVTLTGEDGVRVAIFGVPYLEPDIVRAELGAERSHESVLAAAMDRVRQARPAGFRSVVVAHAFITARTGHEPTTSDSERDVRVGGVPDAPASVFAGVDYVALGHLHGEQTITAPEGTLVRYSGSPLAFSFSEEDHVKSVVLVDVPAEGPVQTRTIPTPVVRPLRTIRGTLATLVESGHEHADAWVRAVVTDARRPEGSLESLRGVLPYLAEVRFEPEGRSEALGADPRRAAMRDPLAIGEAFIHHVTGTPATAAEAEAIRVSVEQVRVAGASR